ncbi:MAG TPA: DKNYY domain-containing protein [Pyrinomonadaceae bacterium]|nr:DKNYY domain-containing protein [Pyrinomonadaceae bacterium]
MREESKEFWKKILNGFLSVGFILTAIFLSACPKRLVGGYEIKDGKVIYQTGLQGLGTTHSFEVEGADAASFDALNKSYGKDKNNAYLYGKIIPNSHGATFKIVREPYTIDQNHVFYATEIISDKPQNFKIIIETEKNTFASDGEKIFLGKMLFFPESVDLQTFEQIGKTNYFRDKNHVFTANRLIDGADPRTFEVNPRFNEKYAKDKSNVFYAASKVDGCDVATHQIIDENYHKDQTHVFFVLKKFSDDAANFEKLSEVFSRDGKFAYWKSTKISDDAKNFVAFPSEKSDAYAKDSRTVFWCDKKMENVDIASFVGLNHHYAKDKNKVYFAAGNLNLPRILEKADAATFEIVKNEDGIDAKDKDNFFNFGTIRKPR